MRKQLFACTSTLLMAVSSFTATAQTIDLKEYLPEVHGTIRGKYEYQTTNDEQRFQVRNARISFLGNLHPKVSYKAEIDLCDEGEMKMLDAYV